MKISLKTKFAIGICMLFVFHLFAQVGINTTTPDPGSILDIKSTSKGLLIPRISLTSTTNQSPVTTTDSSALTDGILVYNIATTSDVTPGFYYWKNTKWNRLSSENVSDNDWYTANSTSAPTSINSDIFTYGKVGVGINNPIAQLHVYETGDGTAPSNTSGSILLQHQNAGGTSSITFKSSADNSNSDYAYIQYSDDGSGNGSEPENGLLEIGVLNDANTQWQDDMNLLSSGSIGINNRAPNGSASLDMGSTDQGILINRVSLSSTTDTETIRGTEPTGLLVFNTATTSNVSPGFYYWANSKWNRLSTSTGTINNAWYEKNTTTVPEDINDNIYTFGQVGIGTNNPNSTLHIYEATGTTASASTGTVVLEHGDGGGESSIIFKSKNNSNNDYGYIKYSDDGSGNGSTSENGLLSIGVENDVPGGYQDDININPTGSLGIQNNSPDGSASIDMGRTDRGILINRVSLTSLTAGGPINTPATGLMVYNTNTTGTAPSNIYPGFYYWNGSRWLRFGVEGYSIQYTQNSEVQASNTLGSYVNIPNLNKSFTPAVSGTYQIIVTGYYASGSIINTTLNMPLYQSSNNQKIGYYTKVPQNGIAEASIRLQQNSNTLSEKIVTSNSLAYYPSQNDADNGSVQSYYEYGNSVTIIVNTSLTAGQSYTFNVQGKEWSRPNLNRGVFGADTSAYANSNNYNDAHRATMTITLISQN
ncbi:hypothetical protein ACG2LH_04320 [Zhouia sp. PK063]|uniref:hypothetical protein n=1 Tax=Zhouia sp. PK063 TaxID=3373602 RepID=UPI0037BD1AF5